MRDITGAIYKETSIPLKRDRIQMQWCCLSMSNLDIVGFGEPVVAQVAAVVVAWVVGVGEMQHAAVQLKEVAPGVSLDHQLGDVGFA
ncbi:hypothetical protein [Xenorhabdus griffiniae]|uniref:hypothetical protein n=1 Tax=Xenorhabdus griffiniae TaxID=351672 RepID=UPI00187EB571|nr:hypothetical protein [Xenorhabdus griffiniae]MBE8587269.1 hypothetical protein [Xenorhabdus griffiniae]